MVHGYLAKLPSSAPHTLDVTLVRACFDPGTRTGLRVHTLAIPPYARLGGDVVDQAVMDQVVWPQIL